MSEINGPKFSVNQMNFSGIQKAQVDVPQQAPAEADAPKINDFSDPKAEALGRSMLFKGADDTQHDLKVLLDNPQVAEKSDEALEGGLEAAQEAGVANR